MIPGYQAAYEPEPLSLVQSKQWYYLSSFLWMISSSNIVNEYLIWQKTLLIVDNIVQTITTHLQLFADIAGTKNDFIHEYGKLCCHFLVRNLT